MYVCGNSGAGTLPLRLNPSNYVYVYVLYIVCIDVICNMCKWCDGVVCIIYNIYWYNVCVLCIELASNNIYDVHYALMGETTKRF